MPNIDFLKSIEKEITHLRVGCKVTFRDRVIWSELRLISFLIPERIFLMLFVCYVDKYSLDISVEVELYRI